MTETATQGANRVGEATQQTHHGLAAIGDKISECFTGANNSATETVSNQAVAKGW